jgi:lipopolysaccharide/colanic/teichoic acid biosynthesis glycosyltransferase
MINENTVDTNLSVKVQSWISLTIKRTFDIVVSMFLLFILAPFFGLIAFAIKRDSPGPVFYRGQRIGKNGKSFRILKFRTMYETNVSYQGPRVTAKDDPRITRLGHWLRETKLNELPQFWNVLIGEMSIVGPRPEDPSIARTWPRGAWEEILSVRPGITSPASVLYHDEESMLNSKDILQKYLKDLTPDKLRLDQLYIHYRSFTLDLDILLWTALIMIPRIGAFLPPEQLLFVGPITRLLKRYINWFGVDILITMTSIGFAGFIWRISGPLDVGLLKSILLALGFSLLFSVAGALWGVNRVQWEKAFDSDVLYLIPPWLLATVIALVINTKSGTYPVSLILVASLLALNGFIIVRFYQRLLTSLTRHLVSIIEGTYAVRERVLIVGSGRTAEHVAWILSHQCYSTQFKIIGFIDDDLFAHGMRIYGAKVIGGLKDVPSILKNLDVGLIILADHRLNYREFVDKTRVQDTRFQRVMVAPDLFGSMNFLTSPSKNHETDVDEKQALSQLPCEQCLARQSILSPKCDNEMPRIDCKKDARG